MGMTVKIRANTRTVYGGPESGAAEFSVTGSATAFSTRLSPGSAGFAVTATAYAERTGDSATTGAGNFAVTATATTTVVHQVLTAAGAATVAIAMTGFAEADAATGTATMSFTGAAAVNVTRTQAGAATLAITATRAHILSAGEYMSLLTGLASGTTYHIRAYATNEGGTSYGSEVDFAAAGSTHVAAGSAGFTLSGLMGASSPLYNVMDYGAHANGTTTDVDHIHAAITAASATGGTVYLPTGTYYLGTTLTLPSGSKLLGDGVALTWLKGTVTYDGSSTLTGICTGAGGLFNVMDYGAHANDSTTDVDHILSAIAAATAAGGGTIYVPNGTYYLGSALNVPAGTTLVGESMTGAWLKGTVQYNSNSLFTDLKMGDSLSCTKPGATTTTVTFRRCHFRGGGATGVNYPNTSVLRIGSNYSCDHVSFYDCEVERNLGSDPTFGNGFNNVQLIDRGGVHCNDILFDGCHLGVTNGVATGSPRFTVEAYTASDATTSWHGLTFNDCILESGDASTLDFSDIPAYRGDYITVTGCTIHGGGVTNVNYGNGLCLELPFHANISGNTFYRSWTAALIVTHRDNAGYATGPAASITGNTFDLTQGVPASGDSQICLKKIGNVFTGNSIDGNGSSSDAIVALWYATGNTVTGNTFTNRGGMQAIKEYTGCSGNTITPNTGA